MKRARISRGARADLKDIYRYIACDNQTAALGVMARLRETFDLLASQPTMGESREDLAPNVRMFVMGSYVILFRPVHNRVEIAQVVHSARDLKAVFGRYPGAKSDG